MSVCSGRMHAKIRHFFFLFCLRIPQKANIHERMGRDSATLLTQALLLISVPCGALVVLSPFTMTCFGLCHGSRTGTIRDLILIQQRHEPPTVPVSARDTGQCPREELSLCREEVTSIANRPYGDTRWDTSTEVTSELRLRFRRCRARFATYGYSDGFLPLLFL
ncbi:hypothetical protein WISP_73767 [Willisornis vidua]|uniref:Uncharacterized protein n=1 Tax=Willisornis vidua TaxID=1566151 RepID=A0ABQ9D7H0_9PASS|nr:hypothetical protein WISP_73767 [Willisornis vidua]